MGSQNVKMMNLLLHIGIYLRGPTVNNAAINWIEFIGVYLGVYCSSCTI